MYNVLKVTVLLLAITAEILAYAVEVKAETSAGTKIAFVSNRDGNLEIYVMNSDGTAQTRLTNTAENESYPAWSPDGRTIAFLRQTSKGLTLNLIDEHGGNFRRVPNVICDPGSIDWSPDGRKLVFQSGGDIQTIGVDGAERTSLTMLDSNPAWSPGGLTIVFERNLAPFGANGLYQINSTGGGGPSAIALHTFPYQGYSEPSWSPDGTKLVFTMPSDDLAPIDSIMSIRADGTGLTPIMYQFSGTVSTPKYSPDGQNIVFAQTPAGANFGAYQIRLIDRPLTDMLSSNFQPDWQPFRQGVSISGRVVTPNGLGLRNAVVVLTDQSGTRRTVTTSSFGLYGFQDVQPGMTYIVSVASKRYRFQTRSVTSNENVTGFDFIGLE